jgi:hypothetical protein
MTKPTLWADLQTRWAVLSHYQRFEGFVAPLRWRWASPTG